MIKERRVDINDNQMIIHFSDKLLRAGVQRSASGKEKKFKKEVFKITLGNSSGRFPLETT